MKRRGRTKLQRGHRDPNLVGELNLADRLERGRFGTNAGRDWPRRGELLRISNSPVLRTLHPQQPTIFVRLEYFSDGPQPDFSVPLDSMRTWSGIKIPSNVSVRRPGVPDHLAFS